MDVQPVDDTESERDSIEKQINDPEHQSRPEVHRQCHPLHQHHLDRYPYCRWKDIAYLPFTPIAGSIPLPIPSSDPLIFRFAPQDDGKECFGYEEVEEDELDT